MASVRQVSGGKTVISASVILRAAVATLGAVAIVLGLRKRVGLIASDLRKARLPPPGVVAPRAERVRFYSAVTAVALFFAIAVTGLLGASVAAIFTLLLALAASVLVYLVASAWSGFSEGRSGSLRKQSAPSEPRGSSHGE